MGVQLGLMAEIAATIQPVGEAPQPLQPSEGTGRSSFPLTKRWELLLLVSHVKQILQVGRWVFFEITGARGFVTLWSSHLAIFFFSIMSRLLEWPKSQQPQEFTTSRPCILELGLEV